MAFVHVRQALYQRSHSPSTHRLTCTPLKTGTQSKESVTFALSLGIQKTAWHWFDQTKMGTHPLVGSNAGLSTGSASSLPPSYTPGQPSSLKMELCSIFLSSLSSILSPIFWGGVEESTFSDFLKVIFFPPEVLLEYNWRTTVLACRISTEGM